MIPKYAKAFLCILVMMHITFFLYPQSYHPDSAVIYFAKRNYIKALTLCKQSFEKGNTSIQDHYNAGCCASLAGKQDDAFKLLATCIDLGYLDQKLIMRDKDLELLKSDPRWPLLMGKFQEQQNKILKMFSKIRNMKPTDLIPFQQDGLWGYVNKNTLQVVVNPVFGSLGFMGDCAELYYKDLCQIRINSRGDVIKVIYPDDIVGGFGVGNETENSAQGGVTPRPVSGTKGFTLDSENRIVSYSDTYDRYSNSSSFNIDGPFKINGKYYAIAHKKNKSGIIDQEGNSLPHFDFVHYILYWNSMAVGDANWFYFKDAANKSGFINDQGDIKFYDQGIALFSPITVFDYVVQKNSESWGVLDVSKMEWLIKPQPLPLVGIRFSYVGECDVSKKKNDVVEFYFLVRNETEEYFIDKNMKAYKPK